MIKLLNLFCLFNFLLVIKTDSIRTSQLASLKPNSFCCDIPELGDIIHLLKCSNPKLPGPCDDVECVFTSSGFLIDKNTLNKDVYKNHLRKWAIVHKDWTDAVEEAIHYCVDKTPRKLLDDECKAYDVFICTEIAMTRKCPVKSNKCHTITREYKFNNLLL